MSGRVDLLASWSCLLRSSVLVLVCTYFSVPATDENTSGSQFCNNPHLSGRVGLLLFNVIESATFHCFLQFAGTRRSRMQQGQGSREGVGGTECCVSPEIHLW